MRDYAIRLDGVCRDISPFAAGRRKRLFYFLWPRTVWAIDRVALYVASPVDSWRTSIYLLVRPLPDWCSRWTSAPIETRRGGCPFSSSPLTFEVTHGHDEFVGGDCAPGH